MISNTLQALAQALDDTVLSLSESRARAEYLMREADSRALENTTGYAAEVLGKLHAQQIELMDYHRTICDMLQAHEQETQSDE